MTARRTLSRGCAFRAAALPDRHHARTPATTSQRETPDVDLLMHILPRHLFCVTFGNLSCMGAFAPRNPSAFEGGSDAIV